MVKANTPKNDWLLPLGRALIAAAMVALLCHCAPSFAQNPPPPSDTIREIFVPFEDLNIILENDNQRVFLSRKEYEELIAQAQGKPDVRAPHSAAVVASAYNATLEEGRATIEGTISLEILNDGIQAIPLDLAGVGIRSALLDGKPASLGRNDQGQIVLFVEGKGKHELKLALTTLLQTSAATQTLQLTLPTTASTKVQLAIPGNVEVKAGASVITREYDMAANTTRLELLPQRGSMAVVMSLNNKTLQDQRVVVVKSVLVTEVTQGYERIHATVSHRVLHGAVDKFRFLVPAGFEVTRVDSPLLARWEMKQDMVAGAQANVLEALLREPTTESVVLEISASRSPPVLENWSLPRLVALDVAGQVAVVSLLVEDRLQAERIATTGLLPIDAAVLAGAIPETVFKAEPGAPTVRQVVNYYAPGTDYNLQAEITRPPVENRVASSALLTLSEKQIRLSGQFILSPEAEDIFDFHFTTPTGWQVTEVAKADGTALAVERYEGMNGATRHSVRLPGGVKAGAQLAVRYQAVNVPAGWLANWSSQKVDFPQFVVEGATRDSGAIGVAVEDDLTVRPDKLDGLTSLSDDEKKALTGGSDTLSLAYRFDSRPFTGSLVVERTQPSLTAEVYTFFTLQPDNLRAVYELHYAVRDARTRQVQFSLPASTPGELLIREVAKSGTTVKEFTSTVAGGRRLWSVQLAERQANEVRLYVEFNQRYHKPQPQGLSLPLIQAEGVEHQSVLVGVEGSAELDIQVAAHPREVDVGELYAAMEYAVSRRLVGAYGYVGTKSEVKVDVLRRDQYALPAAIVEAARLTTRVSQGGRSQSIASYTLKTKATLLEIRLPPEAKLWTILLDNQPTKPQKENLSLLLTLPAQSDSVTRDLQIVYETPSNELGLSGEIQALAPVLAVRNDGTQDAVEIPQVNLTWTLILPTGYQVRYAGGSVYTELLPRKLAAVKAAKFLWELASVRPFAGSALHYKGAAMHSPTSEPAAKTSALPRPGYYEDDFAQSSYRGSEAPAGEGMPMDMAVPPPTTVQAPTFDEAAEKSAEQALDAPKPTEAPPAPATPPPAAEPQEPAKEEPAPQSAVPADPAQDKLPQSKKDDHQAEAKEQERIIRENQLWADQGLSTLVINVSNELSAPSVTFKSLGVEPRLMAYVVDNRRIEWAAWGVGLLVFLVGLGMTNRSARHKAAYVLIVMLAATVPLLITSMLDTIAPVLDACFYAAAWLVPYFLLAALVCACRKCCGSWLTRQLVEPTASTPGTASTTATLLLLLALALSSFPTSAQAQLPIEVKNLKELIPLLDAGGPVSIPRDAVIIPYDAEKEDGLKNAEKVLVPYEKYVELWNRANPEKKLQTVPPPAAYALAGANYEATLGAGDELIVSGRIEIDLFADQPVTVPLNLVGGVLAKATLDGKAARIQVVQPGAPPANPEPNQQAQPQAPNAGGPAGEAVALLHVSGKGRKTLELAIRMGLQRRGGWRITQGRLPVAPASALTLTIPAEKTEVRLSGMPDKASYESTKANDQVQTALPMDGSLALQWRPKVAEGMVDQSLTAQSTGVIDIREDALRLAWQVKLDFGRGSRDAFKFSVPTGYLVEQVTGENIRGWQVKEENGRQTIDVTLLKAAIGSETLTVQISRRGVVGQRDLAQFAAPDLRVDAASLHQGELAIRRSARLDVRSITVADLSRADAEGKTAAVEQLADTAEATVLLLRPFQSYRFVREGYTLTLAAGSLPQETAVQVRAIVRAGERETTLDANFTYRVQGEPLYRARIVLPDSLEIDHLAPDGLEWSVITEEVQDGDVKRNRKLLTIYLAAGTTGEFQLNLLGKLGKRVPQNEFTAPKLEVLDVQRQEGELVFLPEPDTDIDATQLVGLERVPGMEVLSWVNPEQRGLAKLALRYRSPAYSSTLKLTPRMPRITAVTVTNVRVTPKAIEESLFLRFNVADAGVRELSVVLPKYLEKARLPEELRASVQQKIVEPATGVDGKPLAGLVRVRFVLPEYRQGQINLGLTFDRLLTDEKQVAAIPEVEGGRSERRFVVIENTGRDEVVVDSAAGLEGIDDGQEAWDELTEILGDATITQAYLVTPGAKQPSLTFKTQTRTRVQVTGATIGLAETRLVVDASGAYRGKVEFNMQNETEQFLEVQFPSGARLWTAIVAGEPAKPVEMVPIQDGVVRIPLIKTAQGDGDYAVVLKYGGHLGTLHELAQVDFPLVQTVNIKVEESQVRLFLPKSQRWIDFGGTLQQVTDPGVLEEGYQSYLNKQLQAVQQVFTAGDDYSKVRAGNNLKQLEGRFDLKRALVVDGSSSTHRYRETLRQTEELLSKTKEKAAEQQQQTLQVDGTDNRERLNYLWMNQERKRSKDVVGQLGSNFAQPNLPATKGGDADGKPSFNDQFFEQNSLSNKNRDSGALANQPEGGKPNEGKPEAQTASRVAQGRKTKLSGQSQASGQGQAEHGEQQLELNDYARTPQKPGQQPMNGQGQAFGVQGVPRRDSRAANLQKYQERLEEETKQMNEQELAAQQQEAQTEADAMSMQAGGMPGGGGQPGGGPSGSTAPGMGGGGGGFIPRPAVGGIAMGPQTAATGSTAAPSSGEATIAPLADEATATGLASLDIAIPLDGDEYFFTTPLGELKITARPVSRSMIDRLWGFGGLLLALAIAYALTRRPVVRAAAFVTGSLPFAILLLPLGLTMLVLSLLPLLGVGLILLGIALILRRTVIQRYQIRSEVVAAEVA